ncbi:MAG: C1 family peptidase [Capsulimonadaceae bacterium]|nr:C1 family peptidase [Capsulimonadaceae bacterium]
MKQSMKLVSVWAVVLAAAFVAMPAQADPPGGTHAHGLGLTFTPKEAFAKYPKLLVSRGLDSDRPTRLVLTDYLPNVVDQGDTGSCVGWSTAYYFYSYTVAQNYGLSPAQVNSPQFQFSPNFIWDQYNSGDAQKGMHIYEAMDVLSKQGCCTFQEIPWDPTGKAPVVDAAKTRALKYKARRTTSLFEGAPSDPADPEKLKTVIAETHRPIVLGIELYNDFYEVPHDTDFVYSPAANAIHIGAHAICIIGYDDAKHAFRMVNSWGTYWGDNGFLWLSEDYVKRDAKEGWTQDPGGPKSRDASSGVEKLIKFKHLSIQPARQTATAR